MIFSIYTAVSFFIICCIVITRIEYRLGEINYIERCILGFILFLYVFIIGNMNMDFFYYCRLLFFSEIIVCVSFIDYKIKYVYDWDLISGILVQVGILIIEVFYFNSYTSLYIQEIKKMLLSGIISLLIGYLAYRITDGIGEGDILYFSLCATFFDVYELFLVFEISFLMAFLFCLPKAIKMKSLTGVLAFTPFISISVIINLILSRF